jgi:hypothetical protein
LFIFRGCYIQKPRFDKANWNEENTQIFCDLCVDQIRAGNCLNGTMTTRGYNLIKEEFFSKTGLRHDTKQFKNRWTQCKALYSFWLFLNNQSGLGRRADGVVIASDSFWKTHTEVSALVSYISVHEALRTDS